MRGNFAAQIRRFQARVGSRTAAVTAAVATTILTELVERSPVGDPGRWQRRAPPGYVGGHFRANWQVGLGSRPPDVRDAVDAAGTATIATGTTILESYRLGQTIHFANNVPYARRIEYGWSEQAPAGVVRLTAARLKQIVAAVGAQTRSRT